jgi:hypothetical protein
MKKNLSNRLPRTETSNDLKRNSSEKVISRIFPGLKWAEKSQNNFSYLKQKSILDHIKINLATLIFGPKNGEYYSFRRSINTIKYKSR